LTPANRRWVCGFILIYRAFNAHLARLVCANQIVMKNTTLSLIFGTFLAGLYCHADEAVDAYYNYLKNPSLLVSQQDDPRAIAVQDLLNSISPEIDFHPDEKYPPMDPMEFISRSSLRQGTFGHSKIISDVGGFTAESLVGLDKTYFMKLEGSKTAPLKNESPLLWEVSPTPLVEHLPISKPGARWVMIDFWYTLAYNDAVFILKLGNHQGEWEGNGILVELSTDADGKLQYRLGGIYTAHHTGGFWYCPNELEWTGSQEGEGHPRVFSALGSHASYGKRGNYARKSGLLGYDYASGGGLVFEGWKYMRPLWLEPYFGFKGGWGARGIMGEMSGPNPPDGQTKFYPREVDEKSFNAVSDMLKNRCGFN
jgi:hypothetical protein